MREAREKLFHLIFLPKFPPQINRTPSLKKKKPFPHNTVVQLSRTPQFPEKKVQLYYLVLWGRVYI